MERDSRLLLEVVVGPRTEESAMHLIEGAAKRLAKGCSPLVVERRLGAMPVRFDGRLLPPHPLHPAQAALAAQATAGRARSAAALWASRQTARRAAAGCGQEASDLRRRGVDPAPANLDLAAGAA